MATHSRLSMLFESLLISTLLLSLYLSSCDGTSRSMERMDRASSYSNEPRANPTAAGSCGVGGSCQTSIVEQDLKSVQPKLMHTSSMDSAAEKDNVSDPSRSDHDDSEWAKDSQLQRMMHNQRLTDSKIVRENPGENSAMRNSEQMRDTEWMRGSADRTRDLERNRDLESKMSESANTVSGTDRLVNSDSMMKSDSMRGAERMIMASDQAKDSSRMRNGMTNSNNMEDSSKMTGQNRMGKVERKIDGSMNADPSRYSDRMYMKDSDRSQSEHSENMMDHEKTKASEGLQNSGNSESFKRDSDQMTSMDRMRDSENKRASEIMTSTDHKSINNYDESEMMRGLDRMRAAQGRQDLENTRNADNSLDPAAAERSQISHLDNAQRHHGLSEMMRDSDKNKMESKDLDNTREANNMVHSAAANPNVKGGNHRETEMMGNADQMGLHRKGALESRGDSSQHSRNSQENQSRMGDMESQHASTMRISVADDNHSSMGHMEAQNPSTIEGSSCNAGASGKDCDAMHLTSSRKLGGTERIDSTQSKDSEAIGHSSALAAESCFRTNAADCDVALNGQIRESQKMPIESNENSDCKLKGACRVTPEREIGTQQSIERMRSSTKSAGMSSSAENDCHKHVATVEEEEAMAGTDREHRTRKDREIVSSPKQMKLERMTPTLTEMKRKDSEHRGYSKISRLDSLMMRHNGDAQTMQVSRERHLGSMDGENWNPKMRGSELANSFSNHQSSAAEISGQISCAALGNCGTTSGTIHMSAEKNDEAMGPKDDSEITHDHSGSMSLDNRDLMMNQENCVTDSKNQVNCVKDSQNEVDCVKDSQMDQMPTASGELRSSSKMCNSKETKGMACNSGNQNPQSGCTGETFLHDEDLEGKRGTAIRG